MLMMADYVLHNQLHLISQMMEAQQAKNEPMIGRVSNHNTFERLPQVFTMDDLKIAKGANYEESSYRSIISRWKKEAFVEEDPLSNSAKTSVPTGAKSLPEQRQAFLELLFRPKNRSEDYPLGDFPSLLHVALQCCNKHPPPL